jgi:spore germination protein KA
MNKKHYDKIINKIMSDNIDVTNRIINFTASQISVLYIKELTDSSSLSLEVIKPLIENKNILNVNVKTAMDKIIFSSDCKIESDRVKIEDYILQGMTVILFSNDNRYIVINLKKIAHRTVSNPELNYTLRGPKDCFIENLDTNLSLIRYRLKDKNLRIDYQKVGKRTKARVAVIYFEDIANNKIVSEVKKRIEKVNIDGIIESGELQAFLLNRKSNFFPQMGIAERSDMACGALLEGKVVTLVEGSDLALIAPKVLSEFLWSCDDIYDNKYAGFFHRIIRVIALMLSLTAPAMYVAIVSFHNDILPSDYIIAISQARAKVPFNAVIEVLLIEIIVALLVEGLVRVPKKIGTAVSIVGAIIIGEAAIAAEIFSPLLLIVVSIALISAFVPSDYTLVSTFRFLRFSFIIITGIFGLYGFILGITLLLAQLVSTNSFGVAYMTPFAPFITKDAIKSLFYDKTLAPRRPYFLRTKDKYRGKIQE